MYTKNIHTHAAATGFFSHTLMFLSLMIYLSPNPRFFDIIHVCVSHYTFYTVLESDIVNS